MILRMLTTDALSAFSAGAVQAGIGATRVRDPRPATPQPRASTTAPATPATGFTAAPGALLPRGSLLDLSV